MILCALYLKLLMQYNVVIVALSNCSYMMQFVINELHVIMHTS